MSEPEPFVIDIEEEFERLPHAPIVEAVIHWRARAERSLNPENFFEELKKRLPDYPDGRPLHEIQMKTHFGPEGSAAKHQSQWLGYRFQSADNLHIAQFNKNGFVFSRLKPYEHWDRFEAEATKLWNVYTELANPTEVQRLGVRFINAVTPVQAAKISTLLALPPKAPTKLKLPVSGFMHQTTFEVPGHPYKINVIQTIQPASKSDAKGETLILDLDVFTTTSLPCKDEILSIRLSEMRHLKDKMFFTLIKPKALKQFRE